MFLLPLLFLLFVLWLLFRPARSRRVEDSAPQPEPSDEPLRPVSDLEDTIMIATADADTGDTVCKIRVVLKQEVFTPPLPKGTHYKLLFDGVCAVKFTYSYHCFDACYKTAYGEPNFTERHQALKLDGNVLTARPLEADRADHRYLFHFLGTGSRLAVLLESPIGSLRKATEITEDIYLTVMSMTQTEISQYGLDTEERRREADARRIVEEMEQQARKQQEEMEQQARELAVATYTHVHLLDPAFRPQFVKEHRDQIATLKDQWVAEYRDVLADVALRRVLEEHHPHVMPILTARMEVLALAERLPFDEQLEQAKQAEERKAQARAGRITELVLTFQEYAHYESDEWIADYVAVPKHREALLAEEDDILKRYLYFHRDQVFIDELKACSPSTYRRAMWEVRALALADKLSARRRLSDEEKEAKILRFRQRMLDRLNVRAQDEIAKKLHRFESARQLREQAEDLGLDEDQIERLEHELIGDLFEEDDDSSNGYHQV